MKGKWKAKIARLVSLMAVIALTIATPLMAVADDFSDYDTPAGYFNETACALILILICLSMVNMVQSLTSIIIICLPDRRFQSNAGMAV